MDSRWTSPRAWLVAGALLATAIPQNPARSEQQPTFRATVDMVAVDVQVVDRDGRPIPSLAVKDFEVTIDGRKRKIVSASYIQQPQSSTGFPPQSMGPGPTASNAWPMSDPAGGRTYIFAIDAGSFDAGESARVMQAARNFVTTLQPNDQVGVFVLLSPGLRLDPTLDRASLRHALDAVAGHRAELTSQYNLSASEIIDISAEAGHQGTATANVAQNAAAAAAARGAPLPIPMDTTLQRVQARECRGGDQACGDSIVQEARALAMHLEERAEESLTGINALLEALQQYPGRKTVVVLSAGMPVSDRPGGRIDIGHQARNLGERAAHANATIYAVYVDTGFSQLYAAQTRRMRNAGSLERERTLGGKALDEFSVSSGGTMFTDLVGSGELALEQILRETSAYYLLGVEPANGDRDGKAHRLRVKVDAKGTTVRSRQWVVMRTAAGR